MFEVRYNQERKKKTDAKMFFMADEKRTFYLTHRPSPLWPPNLTCSILSTLLTSPYRSTLLFALSACLSAYQSSPVQSSRIQSSPVVSQPACQPVSQVSQSVCQSISQTVRNKVGEKGKRRRHANRKKIHTLIIPRVSTGNRDLPHKGAAEHDHQRPSGTRSLCEQQHAIHFLYDNGKNIKRSWENLRVYIYYSKTSKVNLSPAVMRVIVKSYLN